jgi:hypothetical protein
MCAVSTVTLCFVEQADGNVWVIDGNVEPNLGFAENKTDDATVDCSFLDTFFHSHQPPTLPTHNVAKESHHFCRKSSHRIITTSQISSFKPAAVNTKASDHHPATSNMSCTPTFPLY